MFRIIFLIIFFVYILTPLKAQIYDNDIDLKIADLQGVVFKHFNNKPLAIEDNTSFFRSGINVCFFCEYHLYSKAPVDNFTFFVGVGLHAACVDGNKIVGCCPDNSGFSNHIFADFSSQYWQ